jgi:predicted alpha/beta superfamily hydrolase
MQPMPLAVILAIALTACATSKPATVLVPTAGTGRVERLADFPSRHVVPRNVDVWLPDGYSSATRYDVLYMHDGQMLFDAANTWNKQEWRADEVAGELIRTGRTRPFIIVGIWNPGDARPSEYFPQKPFESLTPAQQQALYALGGDKRLLAEPVHSDEYLRFLTAELKPYIDSHFSVDGSREHTFIMGSSMGGLISMYALAEYPEVFGGAACLSTHWPGIMPTADNPIPARFFDYLQQHLPPPGRHRIWFDHGTETLDANYPELQRQVDRIMVAKGYDPRSWQTHVYPGADHSEKSWAARLDQPMEFLLAPRNGP